MIMRGILQSSFEKYNEIEERIKEIKDSEPFRSCNFENIKSVKDAIVDYLEKEKNVECEISSVPTRESIYGSYGRLQYQPDPNTEDHEGAKVSITYVSDENENGNRVFTLLHEFGHLILHIFPNQAQRSTVVDREHGVEKSLVEREADVFASIFLVSLREVAEFIYTEAKRNEEEGVRIKDILENFKDRIPKSVMKLSLFEEETAIKDLIREQEKEKREAS